MDWEFRKNSKLNLVSAKGAYTNHWYDRPIPTHNFLEEHKNLHHAYVDAGGKVREEDRIQQLQVTLPAIYGTTISFQVTQPLSNLHCPVEDKRKCSYLLLSYNFSPNQAQIPMNSTQMIQAQTFYLIKHMWLVCS